MIEQPPILEPSEMVFEITPPREPVANLHYREQLRRWAVKSEANRKWVWNKCKEDFFFWCESFCWLYEPRPEPGRSAILPFIPWEHQRPVMRGLIEATFPEGQDPELWQQSDCGIEKARGEGATWLCLMIILWRWIFYDMEAFGLVSRREETADNADDPDSLGSKIDWALSKMPTWMVGVKGTDYRRNLSKHTWINVRNGSTITAYASTGDLASGGRKTLFFMDELSKFPRGDDAKALHATEPVTNCRWLVSTYNGADGAYYQAMVSPDSTMKKFYLRWTDNPYRAVNTFIIDARKEQLVDPETGDPVFKLNENGYQKKFFRDYYPMLLKRGYVLKDWERLRKKKWSPWYVERCLRPGMTPQSVAQEYDMDPIGSGSRFFPPELLDICLDNSKEPTFVGDIDWDLETLRITRVFRSSTGVFRMWLPGVGGRWAPPPARYVVGCDVAQGLGTSHTSNSAITVLNVDTGHKVAELASTTIMPERLAEIAISLCYFFRTPDGGPALLGWEANGPGGAFRERVLSSPFRNVYYRRAYKTRRGKPTKEMGWWSDKNSKFDLLAKYRNALMEGYFTNPSDIAIREAGQYVTVAGGRLEYVSSSDLDDPTDATENHGDRCIADAMANMLMEYLGRGAAAAEKKREREKARDGSFLYRRQLAVATAARKKIDW